MTKLKSSRDQKQVMMNQDCYFVKMAIKLSEYDQEIRQNANRKFWKHSELPLLYHINYKIINIFICYNLYLLHLIGRLTVKLRSRDTNGERFTGGCDGHLLTWTLLVGSSNSVLKFWQSSRHKIWAGLYDMKCPVRLLDSFKPNFVEWCFTLVYRKCSIS